MDMEQTVGKMAEARKLIQKLTYVIREDKSKKIMIRIY
jgi:hypothetical protein